MTRIKVCGLTREDDVRAAADLGAAYVGFNFIPNSPRCVTVADARRLAACAGRTRRVGVFFGQTPDEISAACESARLDLIQLHRPLRAEDLELPLPVIAVETLAPAQSPPRLGALASRCHAVLLDSADASRDGTGRRPIDWNTLRVEAGAARIFLAGGLTAENVGDAIRKVRPDAVDVASGVEESPGVKDHARMRRFFEAVREADAR